LYLLFVDLDGLKEINDQHGHNAGDEALINTAHILLESFRASDIIARIGGDEFVVISVETPEINKNMLTRRLKESLANYNSKSNKPYKLCFSMGLTRYRG
jgi:diguanylate cyclase (GGDEF)-like protein